MSVRIARCNRRDVVEWTNDVSMVLKSVLLVLFLVSDRPHTHCGVWMNLLRLITWQFVACLKRKKSNYTHVLTSKTDSLSCRYSWWLMDGRKEGTILYTFVLFLLYLLSYCHLTLFVCPRYWMCRSSHDHIFKFVCLSVWHHWVTSSNKSCCLVSLTTDNWQQHERC